MDDANNPKGWTDREILSSLLYLIQKDNITLDWDGGLYAAGRTASGFKQKTNKLIRAFRPEWDAMASGAPVPQATPKKASATTPRKRKSKTDQEDGEDAPPSVKKPRGRPSKKVATPKSEDDEADLDVKAEPKEEEDEDKEIDAEV
ncbi:hypothetical protein COCCADRAFT_7334 [Bipolaris zeicola 26-R-13]|uniref:Uncharacterized protein n=1 Tax=Cochliobolus carbonum (strain 26-R-13) TaxID=930089 RepID=W6XSW6_COCC2|nr:uncharacterized protein COCCADRAFT_7334 [Bipolaris zeicola 26-R-13]EUC30662.1 hypothetical protein COCCADRAFT_7334 [Bipolaris zeicola 26-R-13]